MGEFQLPLLGSEPSGELGKEGFGGVDGEAGTGVEEEAAAFEGAEAEDEGGGAGVALHELVDVVEFLEGVLQDVEAEC